MYSVCSRLCKDFLDVCCNRDTHAERNAYQKQALRTLQTIIGNVVNNPHEAKYRQVKRSNATFDRKVGSGAHRGIGRLGIVRPSFR